MLIVHRMTPVLVSASLGHLKIQIWTSLFQEVIGLPLIHWLETCILCMLLQRILKKSKNSKESAALSLVPTYFIDLALWLCRYHKVTIFFCFYIFILFYEIIIAIIIIIQLSQSVSCSVVTPPELRNLWLLFSILPWWFLLPSYSAIAQW